MSVADSTAHEQEKLRCPLSGKLPTLHYVMSCKWQDRHKLAAQLVHHRLALKARCAFQAGQAGTERCRRGKVPGHIGPEQAESRTFPGSSIDLTTFLRDQKAVFYFAWKRASSSASEVHSFEVHAICKKGCQGCKHTGRLRQRGMYHVREDLRA